MPGASLVLLFVAAGLLLILGIRIGRSRGAEASARDAALMAAMTGVAIGFLVLVLPVFPLLIFPMVIGAILVATWLAERRWLELGTFLVAGGLLWCATETLSLINDLGDPAVYRPAWTPIPFGMAIAAVILGASLVMAGRREGAR
ncbi:MAG: hypothetical protein M3Y40_03345 [Chloroflexota bacterium]|jgi:hypothetical protein|nr:hypothetical protein [Chloroflexota bacterium]